MARRRAAPEEQVAEGEENAEYVECPMCHGAGRGCKYCVGHGDVHPDDVDAIMQSVQSDKNKKLAIGIGAGVLGVLLIVAIVMIAKSGNNQDAAAGSKKAGAGTNAPPKSVTFGNTAPPQGYSDKAKELWQEMVFQKKCKNWDKVIEFGQQALPLTQDEIQKKNIQQLIEEAQAKKGTK
jgi:hypothetical protein